MWFTKSEYLFSMMFCIAYSFKWVINKKLWVENYENFKADKYLCFFLSCKVLFEDYEMQFLYYPPAEIPNYLKKKSLIISYLMFN